MNHFMLPDSGDGESPISALMDYGNYAMEMLINAVLKTGSKRENLDAKVFGGGNVLRGFVVINVGGRNTSFVKQYLYAEHMRVATKDLNDLWPREVYFFSHTVTVLVKKIKQLHNNILVKREQDCAHQRVTKPIGGAVDLF